MDYIEYSAAAERTEKKFPDGLMVLKEKMDVWIMLQALTSLTHMADVRKKELVYGKEYKLEDVKAIVEAREKLLDEAAQQIDAVDAEWPLTQMQAEVLHHLLGMWTELGEISDILLPFIFENEGVDPIHLGEEIADFHWYQSGVFRNFGIDEPTIREANVRKLQKRYPEKYSDESAINRDAQAERAMLEADLN